MRIFRISPFRRFPLMVAFGWPWELYREFGLRFVLIQWVLALVIIDRIAIVVRLFLHRSIFGL